MAEVIGGEWRTHYLYRAYAVDGSLLYIGVARDLCARLRSHRSSSQWWAPAVLMTAQAFPDWRRVRSAERAAIHNESPSFNRDLRVRSEDLRVRSGSDQKALRSLPQIAIDLRSYSNRDRKGPKKTSNAHAPAPAAPQTWEGVISVPAVPVYRAGHCGYCDPCIARHGAIPTSSAVTP